jgi:small-conductance mechanosensitive channel
MPNWLQQTLISLGIIGVSWILAKVTHYILTHWATRFTKFTVSDLDDRIIESVRTPVYYIIILLGLYIAIARLPLSTKVKAVADGIVFVLGVVIAINLALKVVDTVIEWYGKEVAARTETTLDDQLIPLAEKVVNIFILAIGLITVLKHFGYDVFSLLTALGVGSLAIGLAAKETLTNMLSGFTIMVDRPFGIGDRIELTGGQVGDVLGLRSTRIMTPEQNILVVPNAELVNTKVINLSYPSPKLKNKATVGIAYGSDIGKAKVIMKECALSVPSVSKDPAPDVFFTKFGDFSLELMMVYTVDRFAEKEPSQDAINMLILKRFQEEGIEIPFPTRVVYSREA